MIIWKRIRAIGQKSDLKIVTWFVSCGRTIRIHKQDSFYIYTGIYKASHIDENSNTDEEVGVKFHCSKRQRIDDKSRHTLRSWHPIQGHSSLCTVRRLLHYLKIPKHHGWRATVLILRGWWRKTYDHVNGKYIQSRVLVSGSPTEQIHGLHRGCRHPVQSQSAESVTR